MGKLVIAFGQPITMADVTMQPLFIRPARHLDTSVAIPPKFRRTANTPCAFIDQRNLAPLGSRVGYSFGVAGSQGGGFDGLFGPVLIALRAACPNLSIVTTGIHDDGATADSRVLVTNFPHDVLTTLLIEYVKLSEISLLCIPQTPALQILSIILPRAEGEDLKEEDVLYSHASILRIAEGSSERCFTSPSITSSPTRTPRSDPSASHEPRALEH